MELLYLHNEVKGIEWININSATFKLGLVYVPFLIKIF
jgi:hypothetical protein